MGTAAHGSPLGPAVARPEDLLAIRVLLAATALLSVAMASQMLTSAMGNRLRRTRGQAHLTEARPSSLPGSPTAATGRSSISSISGIFTSQDLALALALASQSSAAGAPGQNTSAAAPSFDAARSSVASQSGTATPQQRQQSQSELQQSVQDMVQGGCQGRAQGLLHLKLRATHP